jgi:hypothetical protein
LLRFVDLASLWFVITEFGLIFWVIGNRWRYQHVDPFPWWGWLMVVQMPLTLFGILWLSFRKLPAMAAWLRSLSARDPGAADIVRVMLLMSGPLIFMLAVAFIALTG